MGNEDNRIEDIRAALAPHGIFLRGGLNFDGDGPEMKGGRAQTVVLLGNVGASIWPAFSEWSAHHCDLPNPLDTWSVDVIRPLAEAAGGTAWFPSERPWQPFQRWAMQAEGLKPSPLGILVHPDFGLWHGYRAAIGFRERIHCPVAPLRPHPCDHCSDKPCLTACPASAVLADRFDVPGCRTYLGSEGEGTCMVSGCIARNACPVGAGYRYPVGQLRFHMEALSR